MHKIATLVDLARGTALPGDGSTKALAQDVEIAEGNSIKISVSLDASVTFGYATDADQGSPHIQLENENVALVANADYIFRPGVKNGLFNIYLSGPANVNKLLVELYLDNE